MFRRIATLIRWLATATALAGGVVLLAVITVTCLSVIGHGAGRLGLPGLAQIPGDIELVELGVGFAVFCALPWCQLNRGHARVDLFAPRFGVTGNRVLDLIAELAMLAAAGLIAYRLWFGLIDKRAYSETTFILQIPLWYGYAACMAAAAVFVLVCAFGVLRQARALLSGTAA